MVSLTELFYSCLILVIALRAQPYCRASSNDTNRGWHRFLNDLCWVCDTQTGGKSVVSLAVEHNSGTRKIWLASNSKSKQQLQRLKWTLGELQRIRSLKQEDLANAKSDFLAEVLKRSYSKVKFYKRQLEIALDETTTQTTHESDSVRLLRESLQKLVGRHHTCHYSLSVAAYAFRKDAQYAILRDFAKEPSPSCEQWSRVRHYLGRLGSWCKAVECLVRASQKEEYQLFLDTVKCDVVPSIKPASSYSPSEQSLSYIDHLQRAFPDLNKGWLNNSFARCTEDDRFVSKVPESMPKKGLKPMVHAEIKVLEHFTRGRLTFAGDRYIACSKPPCYCCAIWTTLRDRAIAMRPPHGNAYRKWYPPLQSAIEGVHEQTQGNAMLEKMTNQMKHDIRTRLYRRDRITRHQDSITDISTTLPSMRIPFSLVKDDEVT